MDGFCGAYELIVILIDKCLHFAVQRLDLFVKVLLAFHQFGQIAIFEELFNGSIIRAVDRKPKQLYFIEINITIKVSAIDVERIANRRTGHSDVVVVVLPQTPTPRATAIHL